MMAPGSSVYANQKVLFIVFVAKFPDADPGFLWAES